MSYSDDLVRAIAEHIDAFADQVLQDYGIDPEAINADPEIMGNAMEVARNILFLVRHDCSSWPRASSTRPRPLASDEKGPTVDQRQRIAPRPRILYAMMAVFVVTTVAVVWRALLT